MKFVHSDLTRLLAIVTVSAILAILPLPADCQAAATADTWTVKVTGGEVRGVVKDGVATFKGIPFAAPPLGDLRWKAPQPVKPWDGVRDAYEFAPAPIQAEANAQWTGAKAFSEDCLYLDVWTPTTSADERLPVIVWIFGGAFAAGATSCPATDGTLLAKKGVVMVSIAYRVGALGFLAHPELSAESGKGSGCYGIQDQIAGLRWVKENIAQFGGDPSRVTIYGGSAGGISVNILTASPAAKGLFHRAISESGGSMAPTKQAREDTAGVSKALTTGVLMPSLQYAEEQGTSFLAGLGAADIRAARALDAKTILTRSYQLLIMGKVGMFWPVADGETIVGDPYEVYQRGLFNDTPILVGTCSDDGAQMPTGTPEQFEKAVRKDFSLAADEILAAYPHATDAEALRSGKDILREIVFAWPTWAWASLQSQKGNGKAYLYYFDYGAQGPGNIPHGGDLRYIFGTLDVEESPNKPGPGATPENKAMSDLVMSYWVNFAANGDPNGPGLPEWPAFDSTTNNTMIFRNTPEVGPTPNIEKLKAIDVFYARMREQRRK